MRRALRALSTVLIISGSLMLVDAGLTLAWQEPISAIYAKIQQERLAKDLQKIERAAPTPIELHVLKSLANDRRRMAFLARSLRRKSATGAAVGRIRIPKIGASYVIVNGTDTGSLRKGPGIYEQTPFPGAPGTTGIAGHRTTYLAPFRHIDRLKPGDRIEVEMPYGRFEYAVQMRRIVPPTEVSVVRRVSYDRLVLSACHPLYSAAKRIVVFARLVQAVARGSAAR
ncbi:MAG: sortase [Solirubrobacteraceae bacterium]|jgi:sortase A|nr:sortase [Solirubrobacteraceae bacterium]